MNAEHNRAMRVADDIDAALKMLGETQPPAEIVSRVHQRLEAAAMSQAGRSGRRFFIPAAGVAMAALACFAIFIQMHRGHENSASAIETARVVANTPLAQVKDMPPSATVETERADEGKRLVQFHTRRRSRPNSEHRRATNFLSYPLTQQEKLLVRFVQTAKPEDLRDLNPEYQAKVEAQQEAEFAAYVKSDSNADTESATQTTESTQE